MSTGYENEQWDVVVVGGGSAAFESAVASAQGGAARVLLLEKAPEAEFGGNARFSHTGFRWVLSGADEVRSFVPHLSDEEFATLEISPYTRTQFLADLKRVTRGRIRAELAEAMVDDSNAAMHWMLDLGIEWEPEFAVEKDGKRYFNPGLVIQPKGGMKGGLYQLECWRDIALSLGVEVRYESPVTGLLGDSFAVTGVEVSTPEGRYTAQAHAVILCSGGFQASAEKRAKYLPTNADIMKVRGSKHDTGEVLEMALALGAKPGGHWQGAHATPIDAQCPDEEPGNAVNRYGYNFGITVNTRGKRFFDEGESFVGHTFAKVGWAILAQPEGVAYQIYDQDGVDQLMVEFADYYASATPEIAGTIGELAERLDIPTQALTRTVEDFKNAVRGDVPFDPAVLDGRHTEGIEPVKSNWARALERAPYYAYPVTGGITFTFGGLQVDSNANVLNVSNRPIGGLFASGDILGIFFHNYPSMTGQIRNVVFSRRAGRNAALRQLPV